MNTEPVPKAPVTPTKESFFSRHSVTLKLITITVLMLLLLIPSSMVQSIIREREASNAEATREASSKWANEQQINGPILTIPIVYTSEEEVKGEKQIVEYSQNWHVLPEKLVMGGDVQPKKLERGIYEIIVYDAHLSTTGTFDLSNIPTTNTIKEIQYDKAFLTVGISDLRGIRNQLNLKFNQHNLRIEPGTQVPKIISSGITAYGLHLQAGEHLQKIPFQLDMDLQGSRNLSFVPLGKTTTVDLMSTWDSPSFNGSFLPTTREIDENGFRASWSMLQLNRNFPQSWTGNHYADEMKAAVFGVDLINPLDDYQKAYRSAKYAAMTIALTFLIFFLVEILNKQRIHPFQYALVGLALCLFYTLLVSISEHWEFDQAYGVSTIAIVAMISLYSLSIFKAKKLTVLLFATLFGIYGFLFVTLQLADYALLIGSIGLTTILGLTMFFTRKINWYKINIQPELS